MAYDTNILFRLQALSTDSAPTDIVDSTAFTTAGAVALVDIAGEAAWNFPPASNGTKSIPAHGVQADASGTGCTLVVRYRINAIGGNNFDKIIRVGTSVLDLEKNGFGALTFKTNNTIGGQNITEAVGAGVIKTLVCRQTMASAPATDNNNVWVGGLSRTGDLPNYTSVGYNLGGTITTSSMLIQALGTLNIDILDLVLYSEEKTDAECAQLADNLRTVLPAPSAGTTPITFTGPIPTLSYAVDEVVSEDLSGYFSGTETPFTFANTGTALTGSGLTLSSAGLLSGTYAGTPITGVIVTGTDTATNTAASNAFNIETASVTYDSTVAFAWPIFSVSVGQESTEPALPTFTSEPLKNNANVLLASEALDYVAFYDNSDGSLVLRVTGISTNASGVFSVSNAALSAGVTYKVDWKVTSQTQGRMPSKAAV